MKVFDFIFNPREIRQRLGLNQEAFWTRIGVTQSGGSRYEAGALHAEARARAAEAGSCRAPGPLQGQEGRPRHHRPHEIAPPAALPEPAKGRARQAQEAAGGRAPLIMLGREDHSGPPGPLFLGGWGGIRTHEGVAPLPVFKTGAFNRSATHPGDRKSLWRLELYNPAPISLAAVTGSRLKLGRSGTSLN
jgi:hypothetical protein